MAFRTLDDVLSFAEIGLKMSLYDWQLKVLATIDRSSHHDRIKVAVCAPNGSGKSERIVAISILRWLNRFPRGRVISTSADSKQLDSQVMPALKAHQAKFPGWEFLGRSIRTHDGGFMLGFTTDEPARAEGHHSNRHSPLLVIVDEAKSVDNEIFQAFDRCSYNVLLLVSSPGLKQGRFYDAFTQHREQFLMTMQVGLTDCPHISGERIQDVIDTYGEHSPFTRSTLYGEFMAESDSQPMAVNYERLMDVINNPPGALLTRHEYAAFCDFAAGGDENVLAIRCGNKLLDLITFRDRDTAAAVGRFIIEFRRHNLRANQIWGDAGGLGHPMCDMLAEAGWPINRFQFGGKPNQDQLFKDRGTEIWASLARRIDKREIVLLNDPSLISQLSTRKTFYDMKGRLRLESKDDMRTRGVKSPDRADAVAGAFAHGSQTFAEFARRRESPWAALDEFWEGYEEAHSLAGDPQAETIQKKMGAWTG
jgi:phage terminase large subunit